MALCFRKKRTHKTGSYFLFSNFCIIIILANVNFAFNYLSEINIKKILGNYNEFAKNLRPFEVIVLEN